jgi:hypothetical protein
VQAGLLAAEIGDEARVALLLLALNEWIARRVGSKIRQRHHRYLAEEQGMRRKIPLIAASLMGLTWSLLSPVATEAEESYYPPYAYSPAYQYGYAPYGCCELSPIDPAYGRPYFYAPSVRRRYVDYRNSHRWGFWGERGAYYLYR